MSNASPSNRKYYSTDYLDLLSEFFYHIENLSSQNKINNAAQIKKGYRKVLQNSNLSKEERNQKVFDGLSKVEEFLRKKLGNNFPRPLEDFFNRVEKRAEKLSSFNKEEVKKIIFNSEKQKGIDVTKITGSKVMTPGFEHFREQFNIAVQHTQNIPQSALRADSSLTDVRERNSIKDHP